MGRVLILMVAAVGLFLACKNLPKARAAQRMIKSLRRPVSSPDMQETISSCLASRLEKQGTTDCYGKEALLSAYMVERMRRDR